MRGNSSTTVDYLSFSYNGNQITSIFDYAGSQNSNATKEYQDKNHVYGATNEMAYDANGNLTKDIDRDIVTIQYNILNLPDVIQFRTGDKIVNTYNAGGQKLRSDYYTYSLKTTIPLSISAGDINNIVYTPTNYTYTGTVYVDNKEYAINKVNTPVNGIYPEFYSFVRMYTTEGYLTTPSNPQYYYYRKDHLGNNREVWCATTNTTVQKTQYYPSGLPWAESSGNSAQPYKYNGKEWIEMHGWDEYDSFARSYYPAIVRTPTQDPHSENYYDISPYAWCGNNPVNNIDTDGKDWYADEKGNKMWRKSQEYEYTDDNNNKWTNIGEEYILFNGKQLSYFQQEKNKDGELVLKMSSFDAVSGKPSEDGTFSYSKEAQATKGGPIPEGTYAIYSQGIQKYNEMSTFDKYISNIGGSAFPGGTDSWGEERVWIYPQSVSVIDPKTGKKVIRTNMSVHGGIQPGSRGCIDLYKNAPKFFKKLSQSAMKRAIYLDVIY
jgi:RHS repeat-associated protein